ncbi:MAG: glycosyltransferase [Pseudomonadota bacterium]
MIANRIVRKLGLNLNQAKDFGIVNPQKMGDKIPRIIHQTYFTKKLSPAIEANIQKLKLQNPGWEYRFYDDQDIEKYIGENFPELLEIYNKIKPKYGAARADFFRYLVIYKEGGVYLDIKSTLSQPLDTILESDDKFILAYWVFSHNPYSRHANIDNPNGEFQQWHIISVKGHPFLKAVIENVCKNIQIYSILFHDVGMMGVLNLTGPIAYSNAILPVLNQHPHRVGFDEDFGLIYSIFGNDLGSHRGLFKSHYESLNESIVVETRLVKIAFPVVYKLKSILKKIIFN